MSHLTTAVQGKARIPDGPRYLYRPRLMRRLDTMVGLGARTITITAAFGYGKTTLAAQWAVERQAAGSPVAWVTLDPADNHSARFWRLIDAALASAVGQAAEFGAASPDGLVERTELIDELIDHHYGPGRDVALIIDNCECLTSKSLLLELDYFIKRIPHNALTVLSGRCTPVLDSLCKRDLEGALGRILQEDLVMRRKEIIRLFKPVRFDVDALVEASEGWPAALVLTQRLAPETSGNSSRPSDDSLLDALCGPLYRSCSTGVRRALKIMALIEPFTATDLGAITGGKTGALLLARTHQETGLLVPVPSSGTPNTFRLHRLFSRYLNNGPYDERIDYDAVHARAARRRSTQGRHVEALRHAGKAHDVTLLKETLSVSGLHLLWRNELHELLEVVREIDATDVAEVSLLESLIALFEGNIELAHCWLEDRFLEATSMDLTPPFMALQSCLEAQLLMARGRAAEAVEVLQGLHGSSLHPDTALFASNVLASALISSSRISEAETAAIDNFDRATGRNNPGGFVDSHIVRAALYSTREEFLQAMDHAQSAIRFGDMHGFRYSPRLRPAHLIASWCSYHRLDTPAALHHNAFVFKSKSVAPVVAHSASKLALILAFPTSQQQASVAEELLDKLRFDLAYGPQPQDMAVCSLQATEMLLALHRTDELTLLKNDLRKYQGLSGELYTISAWELIASGQLSRARQLLTTVTSGSARHCQSSIGLTTAWVLLARVELLEGRLFKARAAFAQALSIASQHSTLRAFAFAGTDVRAALGRDRHHFRRFGHELDIIRAFGDGYGVSFGPALTQREVELLMLLPTLATVEELASDLQISTNTVKTHVKAIYRKLGVRARRDAIATAINFGLLHPDAVPSQLLQKNHQHRS
ncbi:MalT transcriptional regulator family protein [Arthrobacter pigmenti]